MQLNFFAMIFSLQTFVSVIIEFYSMSGHSQQI